MFKESKIPYIELLPIIVLSFILYKLISNISSLTEAISPIIGIFVWAFCIAYILNPLMIYLEKKLKLSRMWSLILTYVIFIGIIILIVTILTPKVISSVSDLLVSIPDYLDMAQKWIKDSADKIELYNKSNGNLEQKTREIIETVSKYLTKGLNTMLSSAVNVTFSFVKGIFIIIISIYILKDKNSLKRTVTRFIYAFTADDKADRLMDAFSEINGIFSRFILGKSLDSIIIGILCFIGLKLLKVEFALLLSVIVGITNMIPYFGPFLGMVPSFIITLFYSPIKALWVIIYIFLLQQFDGWYLGPKILGEQVGLSPIWVITAILIGQQVYGVLGMFLAVPIAATIKIFMDKIIDRRLREKGVEL